MSIISELTEKTQKELSETQTELQRMIEMYENTRQILEKLVKYIDPEINNINAYTNIGLYGIIINKIQEMEKTIIDLNKQNLDN